MVTFEAIVDLGLQLCAGGTEPNPALKRLACLMEETGPEAN